MWKMRVGHVETDSQWDEEIVRYNFNTHKWKPIPKSSSKKKARQYAEEVVERFNKTLREGERMRKVIDVFFDDDQS
ncbi:hypothetical protein [Bacillus cereus group sp. MYBK87-2]|uniref:hypothetical protein n=1 Tax=unclassified Bacillus cereus group TaxID=2750818 RepID=UPI003F794288